MRRTLLDDEAQHRLDRYGFAVVPFLPTETLHQIAEINRDLGPAPGDPGIALYFGFHSESAEYKRAVFDAILPFVRDRVAEQFDDYEIFFSMFITKWQGPRSGFGPHQDPSLVDEREHRGVTVWCPLTDTGFVDGGRDNGMLHVVPGSHEFATVLRVHDASDFVFEGHEADIINRHGVGVPTTLGQAIIFDHRLIHYSMPNETQTPRLVLAIGTRPREATCLHLRYDDRGDTEIYPVDDDYFVDINPFELQFGVSGYDPVEKVRPVRPSLTRDEFARRCLEVGTAPDTAPGRRESILGHARVNAEPFCFLCGSNEGLEKGETRQHGSVQMLCSRCSDDLARRYSADSNDNEVPSLRVTGAEDRSTRFHPYRAAGPPLRVLLTGGSPTTGTSAERLRSLVRELHLRTDIELTAAWMLPGDDLHQWTDAATTTLVVDDVRSWSPALRAQGVVGRRGAEALRGLELRRRLRTLGSFDVALLHEGIGGRVLELLHARPAVVAGLWNRGNAPPATDRDDPVVDLEVHLVEAGTSPAVSGKQLFIAIGQDMPMALIGATARSRRTARARLGLGETPVLMAGGRHADSEDIEAYIDLVAGVRSFRPETGAVWATIRGGERSTECDRVSALLASSGIVILESDPPHHWSVADVFFAGRTPLDDDEHTALSVAGVPIVSNSLPSPNGRSVPATSSVEAILRHLEDVSDPHRDSVVWASFSAYSTVRAADDLARQLQQLVAAPSQPRDSR